MVKNYSLFNDDGSIKLFCQIDGNKPILVRWFDENGKEVDQDKELTTFEWRKLAIDIDNARAAYLQGRIK